jgi:hypothetical protein
MSFLPHIPLVHYNNGSFKWVLRIKGVLVGVRTQKSRGTFHLDVVFICIKTANDQRKISGRIEKFFDFLKLQGATIEEKSVQFDKKAEIEGNRWVFNNILKSLVSMQIQSMNQFSNRSMYQYKI